MHVEGAHQLSDFAVGDRPEDCVLMLGDPQTQAFRDNSSPGNG